MQQPDSNGCSLVISLDAVQGLVHCVKFGVRIEAQSDLEVGVPGDPLNDMLWRPELEQEGSPQMPMQITRLYRVPTGVGKRWEYKGVLQP